MTERLPGTPRPLLRFRYRVVLGCGHGRPGGVTVSSHVPTTASLAKCDVCDRHVPVVVEAITNG